MYTFLTKETRAFSKKFGDNDTYLTVKDGVVTALQVKINRSKKLHETIYSRKVLKPPRNPTVNKFGGKQKSTNHLPL